MPHTMLRLPTVKARTGLSRSTIYLRISRRPPALAGASPPEADVHNLKRIVEGSDTPAGVWFDRTALTTILVSLVAFSVDTLPVLSPDVRQLLWRVEVVTVAIFTIEYALRLIVADSPPRFALSFFGIIDLIAILPFYLSLGVDLRSVRVLRVRTRK